MQTRPGRQGGLFLSGLILISVLYVACGPKTLVSEVDIERIGVEEVKARLEAGEAITFIDSRSSSSWEVAVAKIPGAVRVPPHDEAGHISDIPRENPVVVYCT